MKVQVSSDIGRPSADVWRFWAIEHVGNHPRWDPDIELEQISEGPMGLGTRIRRRNVRWGTPVEGEMEVVEFESERVIGFAVHDVNMEMLGWATFEETEAGRTLLTVTTNIPEVDDPAAKDVIAKGMERSIANVKAMIGAET